MAIEIMHGWHIIIPHHLAGTPGQPDRQIIPAGQQANPANVITMLVGNQQRRQIIGGTAEPRHAPFCFAAGKTAIDHHQGGACSDQGGITPAAAAQRCKAHITRFCMTT